MTHAPPRLLGTLDATAMVAGNMIGSGVFLLAGFAAEGIASPGMLLAAWMVGGLTALAGSLVIAELGTRYPSTGGDFLYLHKLLGPLPAFLYGWMSLVIFESGSIAVLAIFAAKYSTESRLISAMAIPEHLMASLFIIAYTALHCLRVTVGSRFQTILTIGKVAGILALSALLFTTMPTVVHNGTASGDSAGGLLGFSRALVPIFFAYTGWNVVGYMAGEVNHPRRTLPLSLVGGTVITIFLYALLNGGFVLTAGIDAMRGHSMVPQLALESIGRSNLGPLLSALIFLSVVSSLSVALQSGARVIQAMGDHRLVPNWLSGLHPRFATPVPALLVQGGWTIFLVWALDIRALVDSTTVVMVLFSALTITSVMRARKSDIGGEKLEVFLSPGFPLVPVAYVGMALFIVWGVMDYHLRHGTTLPLWGFGFLAAGCVGYAAWTRLRPIPLAGVEESNARK